jgi:futalosine hydrolase
MDFLAILSSMPFESDKILATLKNIRTAKIAGKVIYKGKLSNINVLLMNTGIGKVNAAHSATCLIENFPIRGIINLGVGGAYPRSQFKIGDVAIASKEIYGNEGVITPSGWSDIKEIGIPLVQADKKKYFNKFPLDKKFVEKALNSVKLFTYNTPYAIKSGNFVTVSTTTGIHKRAIELEKRFNAICENMEGAAIAQICTIYKIPLLEVRGISNIVGVREKSKWNLKLASENCQKVVLEIINSSEFMFKRQPD